MKLWKIMTLCCLPVFFSCNAGREKAVADISALEKKLQEESSFAVNPSTANTLLAAYENYSTRYEADTASAEYLFKAAELCAGTGQAKKAVLLYDKIRERYPSHNKAPVSLFLQGFVSERQLLDYTQAKTYYKEFLKKYPHHDFSEAAQVSLRQLESGISDEELVKMFEEKNNAATPPANNIP